MAHPLPELPKLTDVDLFFQVFTHKSARPANSDLEYADNERLAEVGSQVMRMAVTACQFSKRPLLSADQIKEQTSEALSDSYIQHYVEHYGLKKRLRTSARDANIDTPEECHRLMNSYVGAIFLEKGVVPIQAWIKQLLDPESHPSMGSPPLIPISPPLPSNAPPPLPDGPVPQGLVAVLNQTLSQKNISVEYPAQSTGPPHQPTWTVRCLVGGVEKGVGTGKNQKIAKEQAAAQAYRAMGW